MLRIDIIVWPLDPRAPLDDAQRALLSDAERTRLTRFVFEEDRARFLQSHARTRVLLGARLSVAPAALTFETNEHGKPRLSGAEAGRLHFNLTHSHNLAALAICEDEEIGLDVEHKRPVEAGVAQRFFSMHECAALAALPDEAWLDGFHRIWTRKEAFVKARGKGLSIPLDAFDVTLDADAPRITRLDSDDDPDAWVLRSFEPAPGYIGALALRANRRAVSVTVSIS